MNLLLRFTIFPMLFFLVNLSSNTDSSYYKKIGKKKDGFYSQCGQDKHLLEYYFKHIKNGVFVDIGAHNGISYSNTKYFEELGWQGICIEPIPEVFNDLKNNRKCICIQGCISNHNRTDKFLRVSGEPEQLSGLLNFYDPKHLKRIHKETKKRSYGSEPEIIDVQCYLINDLLEEHNLFHVDYLSIDTEGNELQILESIDFDRFTIDVIDVENNYKNSDVEELLLTKGYKLVEKIKHDDIYLKIKN